MSLTHAGVRVIILTPMYFFFAVVLPGDGQQHITQIIRYDDFNRIINNSVEDSLHGKDIASDYKFLLGEVEPLEDGPVSPVWAKLREHSTLNQLQGRTSEAP